MSNPHSNLPINVLNSINVFMPSQQFGAAPHPADYGNMLQNILRSVFANRQNTADFADIVMVLSQSENSHGTSYVSCPWKVMIDNKEHVLILIKVDQQICIREFLKDGLPVPYIKHKAYIRS